MKNIVSWSGGKDSQAVLNYVVEKYGTKNLIVIFCDTGWEHELTYKHVKEICDILGVQLTILKSKKYKGFEDLSKKKGRVPSSQARFCTQELKVKPMIDFILSLKENVVIYQGIRSDESENRSKMQKECRQFKYYFEPYGYDKKGEPKFHNYRKKDVIEWCKNYSDDIIRPIFNWTAIETINFVLSKGQSLNPLYYKGAKRVGCYPCIMCTKGEIKNIIEEDPEYLKRIEDLEDLTESTFFPPEYIPDRYKRKTDSKGNKICTIKDVVRYIKDKNATGDLFAEIEKEEQESSGRRCMSIYNICE